jgi:hypothetical protein
LNSGLELASGCHHCHGAKIAVKKGRLDHCGRGGRLNPDVSKGSCAACSTRYLFSVAEACQPKSCDQCHLKPDYP